MANKSGIHIKKSHKGAFTKKAKAAGMSVQEFAKHVHAHPDNYSSSTRKQANFARVAKTKFKHQAGGLTVHDPNDPRFKAYQDSTVLNRMSQPLVDMSRSKNPVDRAKWEAQTHRINADPSFNAAKNDLERINGIYPQGATIPIMTQYYTGSGIGGVSQSQESNVVYPAPRRVVRFIPRNQTGGTSLPELENTNPGMAGIDFGAAPSHPTFNAMDNMQQTMNPQGGRYRMSPNMRNNAYLKDFNEAASVVTGIGNAINNAKRNRAERFRLIEGMTPRYMQNMEGTGLNNNPAYTMYGGAGMHGEGTSIGIYDHTDGPNFGQYSRGIESDISDRRTESDVPQPVPAKPGKIPTRYMMGGSMQGGLGWDYDDHILYMAYGGADFGVPRTYSEMDNEDYGFSGIAHNGPYGHNSVYRAGGTVSSEKAKEILRDGTVHGQPLTDKQKRYFGWIAGGAKKQFGGWEQEGFMMQTGGTTQSPEDYYKASAELSYYKNKLNDQLKAKNPKAFGEYFKGLQGARTAGQQQGFDYIQNSQYNDYLTPDEVKKALGTDKDYQNYLNSLKAVNAHNVAQGQQPLYGNVEGQSNDPSQLNYGRRFASLQVTPGYAMGVKGSDKHYGRDYTYNPQTGQVDFTETGDLSLRPQGFAAPSAQSAQTTPPTDTRVSSRKYGGKKYTAGRSFMTGPAMQFGGEGYAVGDEIEMSEEMLKNLKKQGYKFELV